MSGMTGERGMAW